MSDEDFANSLSDMLTNPSPGTQQQTPTISFSPAQQPFVDFTKTNSLDNLTLESLNIMSPQQALLSPQQTLLSPQQNLLSPQQALLSPLGQLPQSPMFAQSPMLSPYIVQLQTPQIWGIASPSVPIDTATLGYQDVENNFDFNFEDTPDAAEQQELFKQFGMNISETSPSSPSFPNFSQNTANTPNGSSIAAAAESSAGKSTAKRRTSKPGRSDSSGIPAPIKIRAPETVGPNGKVRDILYQCPFEGCDKSLLYC